MAYTMSASCRVGFGLMDEFSPSTATAMKVARSSTTSNAATSAKD
jgi:hypothetical protein